MNGQITAATSALASRDAQIIALAASSTVLANDLITIQNIALLELSALEAQLAAIQVQLVTEQSKAVIAASSLTTAQQATFTAQADAIAASTATLEVENKVIQSDMARIRAELEALGFSGLSDDGIIVSPLVLLNPPPGASEAVIDKINEFNGFSIRLDLNQQSINDNTQALGTLLADLSTLGVTGLPTVAEIAELEDSVAIVFVEITPPAASLSVPTP